MVQIMHPLHNYANGADYAKWCILGGKMVQICNKLCILGGNVGTLLKHGLNIICRIHRILQIMLFRIGHLNIICRILLFFALFCKLCFLLCYQQHNLQNSAYYAFLLVSKMHNFTQLPEFC